ncbi:MAG: hypothetical protein AUJ20_02670 [Comamonadaceae bacterium CG1_02_60_18]|nr:MAG: hypothetical protein AUJ20_02670 [Comamonadaceae bacterium CG1_02_60_18]PIQ52980.1 MAG: hypothetical protein COW02_07760 [Comamonadaceae bacterium CG12_big_fil_rev_8_21_14_0_65_59_15]
MPSVFLPTYPPAIEQTLFVRASTGDADVTEVCGRHWQPDCVRCDFRLPGAMGGIQMLDFPQDRFSRAVGILQTGELVQTVQARAEQAGYMVMFKPVDPAVLAATLSMLFKTGPEVSVQRRHHDESGA